MIWRNLLGIPVSQSLYNKVGAECHSIYSIGLLGGINERIHSRCVGEAERSRWSPETALSAG